MLIWALFVTLGGVLLLTTPKLQLHIAMNQWHPAWADAAFPWITRLAEGVLAAVALLVLLWLRLRSFLFVGVSHAITVLLVQLLKRGPFADHYRPGHYLEQMPELLTVPGIEFHHRYSFPSGHTAAIFSLCIGLALVLPRRWSVPLGLLAVLVAYSRVYLSQHFLQDLMAGSTVGVLVPLLLFGFFVRLSVNKRHAWLNNGLPQLWQRDANSPR